MRTPRTVVTPIAQATARDDLRAVLQWRDGENPLGFAVLYTPLRPIRSMVCAKEAVRYRTMEAGKFTMEVRPCAKILPKKIFNTFHRWIVILRAGCSIQVVRVVLGRMRHARPRPKHRLIEIEPTQIRWTPTHLRPFEAEKQERGANQRRRQEQAPLSHPLGKDKRRSHRRKKQDEAADRFELNMVRPRPVLPTATANNGPVLDHDRLHYTRFSNIRKQETDDLIRGYLSIPSSA